MLAASCIGKQPDGNITQVRAEPQGAEEPLLRKQQRFLTKKAFEEWVHCRRLQLGPNQDAKTRCVLEYLVSSLTRISRA
jgi:hypothetical protein